MFPAARIAAIRRNRAETIKQLRALFEHGLRDPYEILLNAEFKRLIDDMKRKQSEMRANAVKKSWW